MKAKTLLAKATKELKDDYEKAVVSLLKGSLQRIADCKRTLKRLESSHKSLLNSDVDELELDGYEY